MTFGQKLTAARKAQGLSQALLAQKSGLSQSAVSALEKGINSPSEKTIILLASALGCAPADLLGDRPLPPGLRPLPPMRRVPLVGDIACGLPITAEENIEDYLNVPADVACQFVLRCRGDSMTPRIQSGDLVYIRQQPDVQDGQIAAVLIGQDATLKRVYHIAGGVQLVPENPAYPPMIYTGPACADLRILGLAVAYQRRLV